MDEFKERITKKGREGIFEYYLSRPVTYHLTKILVKTPVTANQVTVLSFLFAAGAAFFFASPGYGKRLLGALLLYVSHLFDVSDGEVARYRGTSSQFGCWLDETTDVLKFYFTFAGLTWGLFAVRREPLILLLGGAAIINVVLMNYFRQATLHRLSRKRGPEVVLGAKLFFGITVATVYATLFSVIVDQVFWLLFLYACLGNILWLMKFFSGIRTGLREPLTHHWEDEHPE